MKAALIVAALLLPAVLVPVRADTVELGGFACLFGENMALLNLYQPAQTAPINFTLSEGQSQYGITLIQVDAANHRVQIEQNGAKQYLKLCSSPDLSAASNPAPVADGGKLDPGQKQTILDQINNSEASRRILAGNPDLSFLSAGGAAGGAGAAAKTGQSSSAPGTTSGQPSSAGSGDGSTPDSSPAGITSQYWYQQSLIFEQERIATAGDVLDGQAGALPLTPLTPPGTPDQLIGKEAYFFNQNNTPRGFILPDSVNPLNAVGN